MQAGIPSRTAWRVALRRAGHQLWDDPLVFADPLAVRVLRTDGDRALREMAQRRDDPFDRALRAFIVARSRLAEELLAEAVQRGVRQYVVLGAGLDTFSCRNPFPNLRTFEVDHPATQKWKRGLLSEAEIVTPPTAAFAPCDFERDALAAALDRAGFDRQSSVFVSWLGVVPYLTRDAFRESVRFLGAIGRERGGCGVVLDYALPADRLPEAERGLFEKLAQRVAAAGEPFQLFFTEETLAEELAAAGFAPLHSLRPSDLNDRYFANRRDGLRMMGSAARVGWARSSDELS
ncbi:MAG TPA: class I SAM-dependent methyltransferase [Phycisphaerae bacterium]|nr:class I SAM-dependent methyltransferase [Phycisphaerae bacterium]